MLWGLTQGCGRQLQVLCTGRVPDRAAVWQALIRACRLFLAFLRWSLHPKLVIRLVTRHALGCGALYLLYLLGAVRGVAVPPQDCLIGGVVTGASQGGRPTVPARSGLVVLHRTCQSVLPAETRFEEGTR